MENALNFIGGEFKEAVEGQHFEIDDPANGQAICRVPASGLMDVVRSVQAANKAAPVWAKTDTLLRAQKLRRLADLMESKKNELARLEAKETGQSLNFVLASALPRAVETFRFFARWIETDERVSLAGVSSYFLSNRLPLGVVTVIASFSDPLARFAMAVGASLAAGNALILKASSRTPQTADAFATLLQEVELPPGTVNILQGQGSEVGQALMTHPGLSTISFTGRTANVRQLRSALHEAEEPLKRLQLSLSASNPVLVFAENDLPSTAAKVAELIFTPRQSVATRGARVFIQETIYDQFLSLLKAEAEKIKVGDPLDPETRLGPIAKPSDYQHFSKAIRQALSERAKLLCGGPENSPQTAEMFANGRFVQPTVLYDLTYCSTLQQEEVIGPLATVTSFKYQHDAIKHANNSPFAQWAYVFHAQGSKSARIAMKLEAGRVQVGGAEPLWDPRQSTGGLKNSGSHKDGLTDLLRFFSRETSVGFDISG